MRAASSSSGGNAMKNWRMMKIASTHGAPKIGTMINGQCVFVIPSDWKSWNSGTIVTSLGMSRPVSTTTNSAFWPGNRMRANAYPAIAATAIVPTVTITAM
jgi:hypothetical protein